MTIADIKDFVLSADPNAQHYKSARKGEAYTVWRELRQLPIIADDTHEAAWAFQIDRFTKNENDQVAAEIARAIEENEEISCELTVDFEQDTGYIHYIFDCEGI